MNHIVVVLLQLLNFLLKVVTGVFIILQSFSIDLHFLLGGRYRLFAAENRRGRPWRHGGVSAHLLGFVNDMLSRASNDVSVDFIC